MEDFVEVFKMSLNPYLDLINFISKYNSLKIFVDNEKNKKCVYDALKNTNKNISLQYLNVKTKQSIDEFEYGGEDVVISCGSGEVADCAKYYAASFSLPIICVLSEDFFDYNMSKFSLLFDGVNSSFYSAVSPIAFFVLKRDSSEEMEAYARAKSIEYFDFLLNEILLQDKVNDDAKVYFKNVLLKLRLENFNYLSIVNAFLRLGMAMTFFDTSKYFLFGFFDMFSFLYALKIKNRAQTAMALISKTYLLAFKYKIKDRNINLNSIINRIAKFLKVHTFCVMKNIKKTYSKEIIKSEIIRVNAYKEYLMGELLRSCITIKNCNVEKRAIEAINYAAFFSTRRSLLKLLSESGMIRV